MLYVTKDAKLRLVYNIGIATEDKYEKMVTVHDFIYELGRDLCCHLPQFQVGQL